MKRIQTKAETEALLNRLCSEGKLPNTPEIREQFVAACKAGADEARARAEGHFNRLCSEGKLLNTPTVREEFMAACKAGADEERARIFGIINAPEAAWRDAQALHLAGNTDMTVEQARAHLATLPADARTPANGTASSFAASVLAARGEAPRMGAETGKPDVLPGSLADNIRRARGH